MRDRDRRPPLREPLERLLHEPLGLRIERGGRLVEHEDRRVAEDRPRDRDALLLAAREAVAALADDRVVASGSVEISSWIWAARAASSISSSVASGFAKRRLSRTRRMEEVRLLRDDADRVRERLEGELADVDAVDRDPPLRRVVEARDEVAGRRLARAGLADERGGRAGRGVEGDVLRASRQRRRSGTTRARRRRAPRGRGSARVPSSMSTSRSRYSKTRSKSASEVCTSTETPSSEPIGKKSRVCSVVNAITVPSEMASRSRGRRRGRRAPA